MYGVECQYTFASGSPVGNGAAAAPTFASLSLLSNNLLNFCSRLNTILTSKAVGRFTNLLNTSMVFCRLLMLINH